MTKILLSSTAKEQYETLKHSKDKKHIFKSVRKTLGLMEVNLRHSSLKTHVFSSQKGPKGGKVFEAYVQNKTPGAYRVFWYYGPNEGQITILAITPHP
ncbi:MAG: hypothetical protein WB791_00065 [Waddliaceae bacterium]